jgi:hypothetical protein
VAPAADTLLPRHRWLLAAIATLAIAVAAGVFADDRNPAVSAWFVLLGTLGATLGVRGASARLLPDMNNESRFVRHLAAGGLAAAMVFFVTLPVWAATIHRSGWGRSQGGHTLAAICLSLLVVDWTRRTSPLRASRISLGPLLVVGIVAVAVAVMLDAAPEVVIGVLCGTCIAVQVTSPWTPRVGRDGGTIRPLLAEPARDVQSADPGTVYPTAGDDRRAAVPAPAHSSTGISTIFELARRSAAAGRYVAMWPVRLLLHLASLALSLATFLLAAALAFDLPGLLESGRIDPRIPRDMRRAMGVDNWPFVLRSLGGVGLFLLACLALLLIMWVRRSRGTTHLLRGIVGAAVLFLTPFVLFRPGIDWGATVQTFKSGWDVWQESVQGVSPVAAVRAAVMFVGAMVLLFWPTPSRPVMAGGFPPSPTNAPPAELAGAPK